MQRMSSTKKSHDNHTALVINWPRALQNRRKNGKCHGIEKRVSMDRTMECIKLFSHADKYIRSYEKSNTENTNKTALFERTSIYTVL